MNENVKGEARRQPQPGLRRAVIAVVVLVAIVITSWLAWNLAATRRLQARIDAIAARGEPVRLADVTVPPVPDDENAACFLKAAAAALDPMVLAPSGDNSFEDYDDYPPYSPKWHRRMGAVMEVDAKALAMAREARSRPHVDWGDRPESLFTGSRPHHYAMGRLASVLADAAMYAHLQGDDREAVERVNDMRRVSSALNNAPFLLDYVNGISIQQMAMNRLFSMTPELTVEGQSDNDSHAATRDQIRELVQDLMNEPAHLATIRRALANDRAYCIEYARWCTRELRVIAPYFKFALARHLDAYDKSCALFERPNQAALQAAIQGADGSTASSASREGFGLDMAELSELIWVGDLTRLLEQDLRARVERRMTAVSLAVRLYRIDHNNWPNSLNELVPDYMPAVPCDPFTADEQPLGYVLEKGVLPDGGDRPQVTHMVIVSNPRWRLPTTQPNQPIYQRYWDSRDGRRDLSHWAPAGGRSDRNSADHRKLAKTIRTRPTSQGKIPKPATAQPSHNDGRIRATAKVWPLLIRVARRWIHNVSK